MYVKNLVMVILYLEGEVDIYNGEYESVVATWDQVWDEMIYLGYDPECPESIRRYLVFEL